MIKVFDVTHHYGVRPVLKRLNLTIEGGHLVAIMGPNGMGKSTLLGVMAGVLWPIKGHVEIDGVRRRSTPENELAIRRKVAYLPDHPWVPLERTGREFLVAVGKLYDDDIDRLFDHTQRLLELFELDACGDAPIRTYSNGQKKKLSICSALVSDAPILLLDEPFSGGLDPSALLALKHVLKHLAERDDVTIVLASQVPELVEGVADRIVLLRAGEIVAHDTLEGLKQQAQVDGTLEEVLERLVNPQTLSNLDHYLKSEKL